MKYINIIVYACDFTGDTVGPETLTRMQKALLLIRLSPINTHYHVIFGAGIIPGTNLKGKDIMCKKMVNLLKEIGFEDNDFGLLEKKVYGTVRVNVTTSLKDAWGTFRETESILSEIKWYKKAEETIVISSSYHIPRIRFCWYFMGEKGARFFSVPFKMTLINKILEPLRYLKVLILGLHTKATSW